MMQVSVVAVVVFTLSSTIHYAYSKSSRQRPGVDRSYAFVTASIATVTLILCGWFLRAATHFLGDGYTILNNLTLEEPILLARNIGASIIPHLIMSAMTEKNIPTAEIVSQLTSIGAGAAYVITAVALIKSGSGTNTQFIVRLALLFTAGNMLLFFGYVETYPVFHLILLVAVGFGWLYTKGKAPLWTVIVSFLLAVFSHVFAVFLIPGMTLLVLSAMHSRLPWTKWFTVPRVLLASMLGFIVVIWGMSELQPFWRFAFLSLLLNEVTTDGVTLLSLRHLSDFANLVLMIFPGGFVLILTYFLRRKSIQGEDLKGTTLTMQYLIAVTVIGMVVAFTVNPGLGMPRDWDLLSFWVIPASFLAAEVVLSASVFKHKIAVTCAVVCNLALLVPRVCAVNSPMLMLEHLDRYIVHDPSRSVKVVRLRNEYLIAQGYEERAMRSRETMAQRWPEIVWMRQVADLVEQQRYQEAIPLARQAIQRNPMLSSDLYADLALALSMTGEKEESKKIVELALGLNPLNQRILEVQALIK